MPLVLSVDAPSFFLDVLAASSSQQPLLVFEGPERLVAHTAAAAELCSLQTGQPVDTRAACAAVLAATGRVLNASDSLFSCAQARLLLLLRSVPGVTALQLSTPSTWPHAALACAVAAEPALRRLAARLQAESLSQLGIRLRVGGGANKNVARLARLHAKASSIDAFFACNANAVATLLALSPAWRLPGASLLRDRLQAASLPTAAQIAACSSEHLCAVLGIDGDAASRLALAARGECGGAVLERVVQKQMAFDASQQEMAVLAGGLRKLAESLVDSLPSDAWPLRLAFSWEQFSESSEPPAIHTRWSAFPDVSESGDRAALVQEVSRVCACWLDEAAEGRASLTRISVTASLFRSPPVENAPLETEAPQRLPDELGGQGDRPVSCAAVLRAQAARVAAGDAFSHGQVAEALARRREVVERDD